MPEMPKVLVTGGLGFLGLRTCQMFRDLGWTVIAYDNLAKFEYERAGFDVDQIRQIQVRDAKVWGALVHVADIRDSKELQETIKDVHLIINCAAQPAMTIALEEPQYDFEVNVAGLINLLELAKKLNVPLIHCSTIHVYGDNLNHDLIPNEDAGMFTHPGKAIREDTRILQGKVTPLHASKTAGEIYVRAYAESYGVKAAAFRLTGIYGPGQFGGEDHGWVANFAIRALLDKPIKVFGTDLQVRDMLYVDDVVQSFINWFYHGTPSGTFNICGGKAYAVSIRNTLHLISKRLNKNLTILEEPKREGDLWWFVGDNKLACDSFFWQPRQPFHLGLDSMILWLEKHRYIFEN